MDWTEQQHHLSGALGAAVLQAFFDRALVRSGRGSRELVVTDSGAGFLQEFTGGRWPDVDATPS